MHSQKIIPRWTFVLALFISAQAIYAADPVTKTYRFSDVKNFVSNDTSCKSFHVELNKLTTQPIALQFSATAEDKFDVKEMSGNLVNFTYQIVAQDKKNDMVSRIGMGSF